MSNYIKQSIIELQKNRDAVAKQIKNAEAQIIENKDMLADMDKMIEKLESLVTQ